jgi:phosphatidylserine/phosphatidylglycerophosphate/cardiolipin synthase-like enzyme
MHLVVPGQMWEARGVRVREREGGFSVHAIAGTNVVLFGFDVDEDARSGLLGFALRRRNVETGEEAWLPNFLQLPKNDREGASRSSRDNPLQAFVWGDYTVEPGTTLRYRAEALRGTEDDFSPAEAVELELTTVDPRLGDHGIWFNRGVAGSQRYADLFDDADPRENPEAMRWLSRGLEEALLAFLERAEGSSHALHGAFYELQFPSILEGLKAASERGAEVDLVVAGPLDSSGDPEYPREENEQAVTEAGLEAVVTWRESSTGIPHNKFLVLTEDGEPKEVWTGSTNVTDGGIFGHSNVGHALRDPDLAAAYLDYWRELRADPETDPLRDVVDERWPVPSGDPPADADLALFSPRHGTSALRWYAELAKGAEQSLFGTFAFGVGEIFEEIFEIDVDYPRYVLLEKPGNDMELLRADPDNQVTTGAYIGRGAAGSWRQFVEERLSDLNGRVFFIHTKYMLLDALTEDPVVITGSANFSPDSTSSNDENMLVIRGDTRVADVYLTEFMRMFTHLRFRAKVEASEEERAPDPATERTTSKLLLSPDDRWTEPYYEEGEAKYKERVLFR